MKIERAEKARHLYLAIVSYLSVHTLSRKCQKKGRWNYLTKKLFVFIILST